MSERRGIISKELSWQKHKNINIKYTVRVLFLVIVLFKSLLIVNTSQAQQLAFPGAEGFGKYTKGGRGGEVIYVENLNDSGPGSLREAVESSGPRIVVFNVGGTIKLNSRITIKNPFLTVAGQTAPGDGILIRGNKISIITHEVILRNIRVRLGDGIRDDAIQILSDNAELYNVVLDHVSVSWGADENIGINGVKGGMRNVSIQNCILGEGLMGHSMGILFNKKIDGVGPDFVSVHNNLFVSNGGRNPMIGFEVGATVINNLVHNWTHKGSQYDGRSYGDVMYNRFIAGQDTQAPHRALELTKFSDYPEGSYVYLEGNDLPSGTDAYSGDGSDIASTPYFTNQEYGFTPKTNMSEVENYVLNNAGALPHDAVDRRYINEYNSGTGKTIYSELEAGGFPVLNGGSAPEDSDNDGMPDAWEQQMGFNINSDDSRGDHDGDGYTNIEEYLNCLMDGSCDSPPVDNSNTAPVISAIADQSIDQDTSTDEITFNISDAESVTTDLSVSATADQASLIDASGIVLKGTGASRTIQITPKSGATGNATIMVVVSDGSLQSTETFKLTVNSTETEPVTAASISSLVLINADNSQPLMELKDGMEIPIQDLPTLNLSIRAIVSDSDKTGSVIFDWNGNSGFKVENHAPYALFGDSNGEFIGAEFAIGTYAVIATSYSESSGNGSAATPVNVTFKISEVSNTNVKPNISTISDQSIALDSSTDKIPFTITDEDNEISELVVTAISNEPNLVDASGITIEGTGTDRTIQITPKLGEWGSSLITVTVSDGELEETESFSVNVNAPEEIPGFNSLVTSLILVNADNGQDIMVLENNAEISTTILPTMNLNIRAIVSDPDNTGSVVFGWNGETSYRIENVAPYLLFGSSPASPLSTGEYSAEATAYSEENGSGSSGEKFILTFTLTQPSSLSNTAPVVSAISEQSVVENETLDISFSISDNETNSDELVLTATSSDPEIIDQAGLKITGSGKDRVLSITPQANATGDVNVTITVSDGELTSSTSFKVAITAASVPNTPPTISSISDISIAQDLSTGSISFTIGDSETSVDDLVVEASAETEALIPSSGISLSGGGATRSIEITPNAGMWGSSLITVTVSDGILSSSESFKVSVSQSTPSPEGEITSFTLINALTDEDIKIIEDGDVLNIAKLPTDQINIRANTTGSIEYVLFNVDGESRGEKEAPYAVFSDKNGNYKAHKLSPRSYTISATPFLEPNGTEGEKKTINFEVIDVTEGDLGLSGFFLINSDTDNTIQEITDGMVVNLAELPTRLLNIKVEPNTSGTIGSVIFGLNESLSYRLDNYAPYAMFGDSNGNYSGLVIHPGVYQLYATSYSNIDGKGQMGDNISVTVEFIDEPIGFDPIIGFSLINSATNQAILDLQDGQEIYLDELGFDDFNIVAKTSNQNVGSISFDYLGEQGYTTENEAPFALFGDSKSDYNGEKLLPGTYSITATPYSQEDAGGNAGQAKTITFVVHDRVETLNNSESDLGYNLQVYPNPFIDHVLLRVPSPKAELILVEVFSNSGTKIYHQEIDTTSGLNEYRIDLNSSEFKSGGIYNLFVFDSDIKKAFRLIKS